MGNHVELVAHLDNIGLQKASGVRVDGVPKFMRVDVAVLIGRFRAAQETHSHDISRYSMSILAVVEYRNSKAILTGLPLLPFSPSKHKPQIYPLVPTDLKLCHVPASVCMCGPRHVAKLRIILQCHKEQ